MSKEAKKNEPTDSPKAQAEQRDGAGEEPDEETDQRLKVEQEEDVKAKKTAGYNTSQTMPGAFASNVPASTRRPAPHSSSHHPNGPDYKDQVREVPSAADADERNAMAGDIRNSSGKHDGNQARPGRGPSPEVVTTGITGPTYKDQVQERRGPDDSHNNTEGTYKSPGAHAVSGNKLRTSPATHAVGTGPSFKDQVHEREDPRDNGVAAVRASTRARGADAQTGNARPTTAGDAGPNYKDQCQDRRRPDSNNTSDPGEFAVGAHAVPRVPTSTDDFSNNNRSTTVDFGGSTDDAPSSLEAVDRSAVLLTAEMVDENERERILEDARKQLEADAVEAEVIEQLPNKSKHRACVIAVAVVVVIVAAVVGGVVGSRNSGPSPNTSTGFDAPTPSPTTEASRAANIATFINDITTTKGGIAYPPEDLVSATPEELAVQWLIEDDPLRFSADTAGGQFRLQQRYALRTLWFQSKKESWKNSAGWLEGSDECISPGWFGLTCSPSNLGGDVGVQNSVTEINLKTNNLHGRIPEDLALLTSVKAFDFSFSSLTGPLPESIGAMRSLTSLDVSDSELNGALPDSIGALTNLITFDIRKNAVPGPLPNSIGQWTKLKYFYTWTNALNGTLPNSIGQWTNLREISVSNNEFTGTIPESISKWRKIKRAWFERNQLTDMPAGICNASLIDNLQALVADCTEVEPCPCCTECCTDGGDCVDQ